MKAAHPGSCLEAAVRWAASTNHLPWRGDGSWLTDERYQLKVRGAGKLGAIGQMFSHQVKSVIASVPNVEINPSCQRTVNASKSSLLS